MGKEREKHTQEERNVASDVEKDKDELDAIVDTIVFDSLLDCALLLVLQIAGIFHIPASAVIIRHLRLGLCGRSYERE